MTYLLAFGGMAVLDFIWGQYTVVIIKKEAHRASFLALGIFFLNALVTVGYTEDHWIIMPAAAGAYLGTYLSVVVDRERDHRRNGHPSRLSAWLRSVRRPFYLSPF